jgi:hypothetical protein
MMANCLLLITAALTIYITTALTCLVVATCCRILVAVLRLAARAARASGSACVSGCRQLRAAVRRLVTRTRRSNAAAACIVNHVHEDELTWPQHSSKPQLFELHPFQPTPLLPGPKAVAAALHKGPKSALPPTTAEDVSNSVSWSIAAVHDALPLPTTPLLPKPRPLPSARALLAPLRLLVDLTPPSAAGHLSLVPATRLQVTPVVTVRLLLVPETTWVRWEMNFLEEGICMMQMPETAVSARLSPVVTSVVVTSVPV